MFVCNVGAAHCAPLHVYGVSMLRVQAPLWLDMEQVDGTYNRPRALKQLFFDVFVSAKTDKLHWTTFVSGSEWDGAGLGGSGWGLPGWARLGHCTYDILQMHLASQPCHCSVLELTR